MQIDTHIFRAHNYMAPTLQKEIMIQNTWMDYELVRSLVLCPWPTVKPKTLWTRFYADISEIIHYVFIKTHECSILSTLLRTQINMTNSY